MPDTPLLRRWNMSRVDVQLPDGTTHDLCMVLVAQGRARLVAKDGTELAVREGAQRLMSGQTRNQWVLVFGTGDADTWLVTKRRNCGCGKR